MAAAAAADGFLLRFYFLLLTTDSNLRKTNPQMHFLLSVRFLEQLYAEELFIAQEEVVHVFGRLFSDVD